jgi:tetratricopeptide (TPR) repeat protein
MLDHDRGEWGDFAGREEKSESRMPWVRIIAIPAVPLGLVAVIMMWAGNPAEAPREVIARPPHEVREAFTGEAVGDDDPAFAGIHQALAGIGAGVRFNSSTALLKFVDIERMLEQIEVSGLDHPVPFLSRRRFIGELREVMEKTATSAFDMPFHRLELRRINFSPDRDEAVAYVRHWDENDASLRYCWWLRKSADQWRVFDLEFLETGFRQSVAVATSMNLATRDADMWPRFRDQLQKLMEAELAMEVEDFQRVRDRLMTMHTVYLPPQWQATEQMLWASLHLNDENYEEVLAACASAEDLMGQMPVLTFTRMPALVELERYEEALTVGQRFLEQLGDDGIVYYHLGQALENLERKEEALDMYRKGLDDGPNLVGVLWSFGHALPTGQKDELRERFLAMENPAAHAEWLCDSYVNVGDIESVETVADAYQQLQPDAIMPMYYQAWSKWYQDENDEAADLVRPLLDRAEDSEQKDRFRELYLHAMLDAGREMEAYEKADDPAAAFATIAQRLYIHDRVEPLRQLVQRHGQAVPGDPLLNVYAGHAAELAEDWEAAATAYGAAFAASHDEDGEAREARRVDLVHALYKLGRIDEALATAPPSSVTFAQLARLMNSEDDMTALRGLFENFRDHAAAEPETVYFEARLLLADEKYSECATMARSMLDTFGLEDPLRPRFLYLFFDACLAQGKSLDAYARFPDDAAFSYLASRHVEARQVDELRQLIDTHRKSNADAPLIDFYLAEAAVLEEDWDAAIAAFRRELEKTPESEGWQARSRLVEVLDQRDQWREAYESIEPADHVFSQLAARMFSERRIEDLAALLDARREQDERHDDSGSLEFQLAKLDYLRGDYESVIERLVEHREEFDASYHVWSTDRWLVAALVHLDRLDEALERARTCQEEDFDSLPLAMVHAARKEVGETLSALDQCIVEGYQPDEFHEDELLGRLLRDESLAAVRQRYPPPESAVTDDAATAK